MVASSGGMTPMDKYRNTVVAVVAGRLPPDCFTIPAVLEIARKTREDFAFDVEILRARLVGAIVARGRN